MNIPKFAGVKRKTSEMQQSSSYVAQAAVASDCGNGNAAQNTSGEGHEGGGGGAGTGSGEVDEEEESSSSFIVLHGEFSRAKRLKHTLATKSEHASGELNTDPSDLTRKNSLEHVIKEDLVVKEYQHIKAEQLEEAERIAAKNQGSCVSKITIAIGDIVAFKCRNKHIFRDTIKGATEKWCPKCAKYYNLCVDFAKKNEGILLDEFLLAPVHFQCKRGHKFSCKSYSKY